jgi:hypothetical protein
MGTLRRHPVSLRVGVRGSPRVDSRFGISFNRVAMRIANRVLLFVMELCILVFGLLLTVTLAEYFDSSFVGVVGLILTPTAFFVTRKKTRKWKIDCDAARWIESRQKTNRFPNRAKRMRAVQRYLLWAPSVCATFVLVFFPAASQVRYGRRLGNFSIPLPWSWTILGECGDGRRHYLMDSVMSREGVGRYGVNPFWSMNPSLSEVWFANVAPNGAFGLDRSWRERERAGAAQISKTEVVLGDMPITCWQYVPSHPSFPGLSGNWEIECEAPEDVRFHDFQAGFLGREADIPEFYRVLQKVRPFE